MAGHFLLARPMALHLAESAAGEGEWGGGADDPLEWRSVTFAYSISSRRPWYLNHKGGAFHILAGRRGAILSI